MQEVIVEGGEQRRHRNADHDGRPERNARTAALTGGVGKSDAEHGEHRDDQSQDREG